jgi:hypothetical protein
MANTPATGNGPFEFTSATGEQISIPLTAFSFDSSGKIVVDLVWNTATTTPPGKALLTYAQNEGLIAPAAVPSPFPAMIIKAADPGTGGNFITVTVAISSFVPSPATNDPTQVEFSLAVSETDVYTGLTCATIESVLGSSNVAGSSPGLVQVVHGSVDPTGVPVHHTGSLSGSPPVLDVPGDGSPPTVFVLTAKKDAADSIHTSVIITPDGGSPPNPNINTFTLRASWSKPAVTGITLSTLEAMVKNNLSYEITVSRPGSGAYSLPAAGVTTLSGGAAGSNASATLFTGN